VRDTRGHYEVHSALSCSLTGQRLGHAGGESAGARNCPLDRTGSSDRLAPGLLGQSVEILLAMEIRL
jgi:hypothetical protein